MFTLIFDHPGWLLIGMFGVLILALLAMIHAHEVWAEGFDMREKWNADKRLHIAEEAYRLKSTELETRHMQELAASVQVIKDLREKNDALVRDLDGRNCKVDTCGRLRDVTQEAASAKANVKDLLRHIKERDEEIERLKKPRFSLKREE